MAILQSKAQAHRGTALPVTRARSNHTSDRPPVIVRIAVRSKSDRIARYVATTRLTGKIVLDEMTLASRALANGRVAIRTAPQVYRIT
jgi:hypothetical protein